MILVLFILPIFILVSSTIFSEWMTIDKKGKGKAVVEAKKKKSRVEHE